MKKLFAPHTALVSRDIALLILRITIALLLVTHGLPKFEKMMSGAPVQFASVFGMSQEVSLFLAVFAELFCAAFVIIGFATRISAVPIVITMAIICFSIHADDPISDKELPLVYLAGFFSIFLLGAGRYSIDYLIHRSWQKNAA